MKKITPIVIIMIVVALLMGACSSNISQIENVKVAEKIDQYQMSNPDCTRGVNCNRYVIFEKNDEQIKLTVNNREMYESLIEGTTVNIQYYNNFAVKSIQFPNMN